MSFIKNGYKQILDASTNGNEQAEAIMTALYDGAPQDQLDNMVNNFLNPQPQQQRPQQPQPQRSNNFSANANTNGDVGDDDTGAPIPADIYNGKTKYSRGTVYHESDGGSDRDEGSAASAINQSIPMEKAVGGFRDEGGLFHGGGGDNNKNIPGDDDNDGDGDEDDAEKSKVIESGTEVNKDKVSAPAVSGAETIGSEQLNFLSNLTSDADKLGNDIGKLGTFKRKCDLYKKNLNGISEDFKKRIPADYVRDINAKFPSDVYDNMLGNDEFIQDIEYGPANNTYSYVNKDYNPSDIVEAIKYLNDKIDSIYSEKKNKVSEYFKNNL